MAKTAKSRKPTAQEGATGIRLENLNPILPPDNEHTNAGTVALANAVSDLADAISDAAKALQEIARGSAKAGILIRDVEISMPRPAGHAAQEAA